MALHHAQSQSHLVNGTCPAGTGRPGPGRLRRFWKAFLFALMRTLSGWAV